MMKKSKAKWQYSMKILIAGDSFAADWSVKYPGKKGWPNLVGEEFDVTNIAQAGSSEYRIWKNLLKVDSTKFDKIIISHTSPYRIYVAKHPVHSSSLLHKDCDLLYSDAVENNLHTIKDYFENYYDLGYAVDIHQLIMNQIATLAANAIHIGHIDVAQPKTIRLTSFSDVWKHNKGLINHYSDSGNKIIYNSILTLIKG
jgi:hypothetical protein